MFSPARHVKGRVQAHQPACRTSTPTASARLPLEPPCLDEPKQHSPSSPAAGCSQIHSSADERSPPMGRVSGEGAQQRVDVDDGGLEASRYHVARNRHRCGRAGDRHASDSPPLDRLTTIRRSRRQRRPRLRIAEWPRRIQVRQTVDSRWRQGISNALLGLSKEPPRRRARRSSTSSTLSV
jgi:hypothetical protein